MNSIQWKTSGPILLIMYILYYYYFIQQCNIKAFPQVSFSPSVSEGLHDIMATSGLGALRPNTVVIPLEIKRTSNQSSSVEILHRLRGLEGVDLPNVPVVRII